MVALASRVAVVIVAVLATTTATVWAQDAWTVTTADFKTTPVVLRGLAADGVHVSTAADPADHTVPLGQFVSAERAAVAVAPTTAPAAAPFTLILSDGDRLVGEPASLDGETLTWAEPLLGRLPVNVGRAVVLGRGADVAVPDERPKQDVVTLANGDTVAGILSGLADGKLTIQGGDGNTTPVPLAGVTRLALASTGTGGAAMGRAFQVRLTDGSLVTVTALSIQGDTVSLTPGGKGAKAVSLPLSAVAGIGQLNGPVGWLSSRRPTESVQVPYLGGTAPWPARFDATVDGGPLAFDGQPYGHGIGVHAYSRLTFAVDPAFTAFRTQYAIDSGRDTPRLLADVTVRVKVDGRTVHEAKHVRAGVLSPVVSVDLSGAKTLTLECDYGDAGDTQAHLNWLQPALLRGSAATTGPATRP